MGIKTPDPRPIRPAVKSKDLPSDVKPSVWIKQLLKENQK